MIKPVNLVVSAQDVTNQSPPFADIDLYSSDAVLRRGVAHHGGGLDEAPITRFGKLAGSTEAQEWARLANTYTPVLRTHDMKGRRLDRVDYHPAYHQLMTARARAGVHVLGLETYPHVARAARVYLGAQMESGHGCPLTMTNAAVPVLKRAPGIASEWLNKAQVCDYDRRHVPLAEKSAVTLGMGMTEKQGGTDVRSNTTRAEPLGASATGEYRITGHKWFMSAPMSDAFLILAQAEGGLTCFLMPRILPDGRANALHFQRLKDKLGNRSNASSEVEFDAAHAVAVGKEGEGTKVIIDMVTETRLDCAVASAGLMRSALAQAIHHAQHRSVFQKRLIDQPLMTHVLANMALDVEVAVALSMRLARAFDGTSDLDMAWKRVMTPVVKFWTCKTAPAFVAEAMECLGGNGYVEENSLARLYREVPVNSIWEGSGNVMALDLVRALRRESDAVAIVMQSLRQEARADDRLNALAAFLDGAINSVAQHEHAGRSIAEGFAMLAAATILVATAPPAIAEAFLASRQGGRSQACYGSRIDASACRPLLEEAAPRQS